MRCCFLLLVLCGVIGAIGACATTPRERSPTEYLDTRTAATVTFVAAPLVFARERRELAAHSRDYVTLAAASVNRGGTIDTFILAYYWSTLDTRSDSHGSEIKTGDTLVIVADDRVLRLPADSRPIQEVGLGTAVHAPPHHGWRLSLHRTDLATLKIMAECNQLAVLAPDGGGSSKYEAWNDERRSLRGLIARLEGTN